MCRAGIDRDHQVELPYYGGCIGKGIDCRTQVCDAVFRHGLRIDFVTAPLVEAIELYICVAKSLEERDKSMEWNAAEWFMANIGSAGRQYSDPEFVSTRIEQGLRGYRRARGVREESNTPVWVKEERTLLVSRVKIKVPGYKINLRQRGFRIADFNNRRFTPEDSDSS
jgi:hypothetical protein